MSISTPSFLRVLRGSLRPCRARTPLHQVRRRLRCQPLLRCPHIALFHSSRSLQAVKPFLLADIGEGTRECQIIQWFVQPGARVEQFDKLCEVQSDKTATDITSPFDGVVKRLYYEVDDMAIVGKPLVDIDIQSEVGEEEEAMLGAEVGAKPQKPQAQEIQPEVKSEPQKEERRPSASSSVHKSLATPAVRHLCKEVGVDIEEVNGTGKDGRVTKEDVQKHAAQNTQSVQQSPETPTIDWMTPAEDKTVSLTPVQSAMYKTMTRSLRIPHFLYTMTADVTALTRLRRRVNASREKQDRITSLPFILKAVSMAFKHHPLLNAALDTSDEKKPVLTYRGAHDFGVAVNTPSGLMVPVIRGVQNQSMSSLAQAIKQISEKAVQGKLQPSDLQGASFTVSNIGSIGGGVVAPIIVEPQVAIVGVGRSRVVPAFDETGQVVQREELTLSWSADHRVVDGAECARAAEKVRTYLESIEELVLEMR